MAIISDQQKIYVLDTNVLVHDPQSLFAFEGANVGIPIVVLEELDAFKEERTERGRSAREVNRLLDILRNKGSLKDGVALANGGTLKVLFMDQGSVAEKYPFKERTADNDILMMLAELKDEGYAVKFITKDMNARVKADVLSIEAEDYLKGRISEDKFYKGWIRIQVPSIQLKKEFPEALQDLVDRRVLIKNEFVLAESQHNPFHYKIFRYIGSGLFMHIDQPKFFWPLQARNPQQLMALNLLMDPNIKMVSLLGKAGTGKTFIALLAGLHQVLIDDLYKKILVSRPVVPLGRDIGYLPGDIQEKLYSWMLPIYDNIEFIIYNSAVKKHLQEVQSEQRQSYGKNRKITQKPQQSIKGGLVSIEDLIDQGQLSMEAITYMRGRSIPYQFILIDEVQNLNELEIKTLVTRVGEGSKIVVSGDPYQIDSPYLDFSCNGLIIASEKFKGEDIFGSVYLEISERSELSEMATRLL